MRVLTAKDVMNPEVVTVRDDLTVAELAEFLVDNEISGAPVEDADGHLVGVVSLTDLAAWETAREVVLPDRGSADYYLRGWEDRWNSEDLTGLRIGDAERTVGEIMTPTILGIDEEATIPQVAQKMIDGHGSSYQLDAVFRVELAVDAGNLRTQHPFERQPRRGDHGHLPTELAQRRCDLCSDPATADYDDRRSLHGRLADGISVVDVAQVVDPGCVGPWDVHASGLGARRQHQGVVGDRPRLGGGGGWRRRRRRRRVGLRCLAGGVLAPAPACGREDQSRECHARGNGGGNSRHPMTPGMMEVEGRTSHAAR